MNHLYCTLHHSRITASSSLPFLQLLLFTTVLASPGTQGEESSCYRPMMRRSSLPGLAALGKDSKGFHYLFIEFDLCIQIGFILYDHSKSEVYCYGNGYLFFFIWLRGHFFWSCFGCNILYKCKKIMCPILWFTLIGVAVTDLAQ